METTTRLALALALLPTVALSLQWLRNRAPPREIQNYRKEAAVAIQHVLRPWGFNETSTIALVAQCRDEIAKPFVEAIDANWLGSFNISSLAGSVLCGKVGFGAAIHHAPTGALGRIIYH